MGTAVLRGTGGRTETVCIWFWVVATQVYTSVKLTLVDI